MQAVLKFRKYVPYGSIGVTYCDLEFLGDKELSNVLLREWHEYCHDERYKELQNRFMKMKKENLKLESELEEYKLHHPVLSFLGKDSILLDKLIKKREKEKDIYSEIDFFYSIYHKINKAKIFLQKKNFEIKSISYNNNFDEEIQIWEQIK